MLCKIICHIQFVKHKHKKLLLCEVLLLLRDKTILFIVRLILLVCFVFLLFRTVCQKVGVLVGKVLGSNPGCHRCALEEGT